MNVDSKINMPNIITATLMYIRIFCILPFLLVSICFYTVRSSF